MRKTILFLLLLPLLVMVAFAQESEPESVPAQEAVAPPARMAYVKGNQLAEWLKDYKAAEQRGHQASFYQVGKAWGFIAGVVDARFQELNIHTHLSMKQVILMVDGYLSKHVDRWHEPAVDLVIAALKEGMPAGEVGKAK